MDHGILLSKRFVKAVKLFELIPKRLIPRNIPTAGCIGIPNYSGNMGKLKKSEVQFFPIREA